MNQRQSATACLSAAIALTMSGLSSAYVSESAERTREFHKLEEVMVADLSGSAQHKASRWLPFFIAAVNGLSPLLMSLIIIPPLWLESYGMITVETAFEIAMAAAFVEFFLLGVFLGKVSGVNWLFAGAQTFVIALLTSSIIFLVS